MTFPIVLAKSLLSLSLLSATLPAGASIAASTDAGDAGALPAKQVHVTRTVAAFDGTGVKVLTSGEAANGDFAITLQKAAAAQGDVVTQTTLRAIPDPLELAKTYAPETVGEWEKTLSQYKEKVKPQAYRIHMTAPSVAEGEKDNVLPMDIAVRSLPALNAVTEGETLELGDAVPLRQVTVEIRSAVALEDAAADGLIEPFTVAPVLSVLPLDEGIVKAQNAVSKALEAGQAEEIRTALSGLLSAYQPFLTQK